MSLRAYNTLETSKFQYQVPRCLYPKLKKMGFKNLANRREDKSGRSLIFSK